jgi:uncharacterized membrane protein YfcA
MDAALLAAAVVVVLAGVITGLAGFGFGVASVPPLLLIYNPPTVVALGMILGWAGGWLPLLELWKQVRVRKLARLLPAAIVGLIAGGALLRVVPAPYLKLAASLTVLGFALVLLGRGAVQSRSAPRWAAPLVGLCSGTLATSTGLAGPPVVLFFTLRGLPVPAFRATILAYLIAIDLIGLPTLVAQGAVSRDHLLIGAVLAPFAIAGRFAGMRLAHRVSPALFRRITLVLLVVTGALGALNAVSALVG